jgi:hypothetical protein
MFQHQVGLPIVIKSPAQATHHSGDDLRHDSIADLSILHQPEGH